MSTDNPTETCGVAVIAQILGVSRQRADVLSRQKGFPDPVAETDLGRRWSLAAVEAYAAARKPATTTEADQ